MYDKNTQQHYLRARWYSPLTGRFNRMDPFAGNNRDPQSLHKYLYGHNNPVNHRDPTGKFSSTGLLVGIGIRALIFRIMQAVVLTYVIGFPLYHAGLSMSQKSGHCGPDVSDRLKKLRARLRTLYTEEWQDNPEQRKQVCKQMYSARGGDIKQFILRDLWDSPKGSGDCEDSAAVNGFCYSVYEINYFLWGSINKLCGKGWTRAWLFALTWSTYQAPVNAAWDPEDEYHGSSYSKANWTTAGYQNNNFAALRPLLSEYSSCDCDLSTPWLGTFGFQWGDYYENWPP